MGVGKSTIGMKLSKCLLMEFIDIDKIIEKKLRLTVQKIFEQKGEAFFRRFEEKITLEEAKKKNVIISLGGGAFMNKNIRDYLSLNSKTFWLDLDVALLARRLKKSKRRPLLKEKNTKLTLEKIYKRRKNTYTLANFRIDCNNLTSNLIVKKIVQLYEKN